MTEENGQQRACLSPTLPVFSDTKNRESIVMPEMDDNAGDIFAARYLGFSLVNLRGTDSPEFVQVFMHQCQFSVLDKKTSFYRYFHH